MSLANVIDILDPDAIVLGGCLSNISLLYDEGKNLVYEKPSPNGKSNIQISGAELENIVKLSRKVKSLIVPLGRRIDNLQIIEQAAILTAFDHKSINDEKIGKE